MGIGFTELILIFLVVLLVFGAKRLPEIAGAMGKAVNEFKKSKDEIFILRACPHGNARHAFPSEALTS